MLALVTIGQSPREDIVSAMFGGTEPAHLLQAGALDRLSGAQIRSLHPDQGEQVLVSRLRDGREVTLAKSRLMPRVQQAVDSVVELGASVVCILCTGDFKTIDARGTRLITPDRLVGAIVDVLLPAGSLGVIMPHAEQEGVMLQKWQTAQRSVVPLTLSPYVGDVSPASIARELECREVDLVVMDCMGYSRDVHDKVRTQLNVPVLLSNRLTGVILSEIAVDSAVGDPLQV